MTKIITWARLNPWKAAVAVLAVLVVLSGCVGLGCGYIKGCSDAKLKIESGK